MGRTSEIFLVCFRGPGFLCGCFAFCLSMERQPQGFVWVAGVSELPFSGSALLLFFSSLPLLLLLLLGSARVSLLLFWVLCWQDHIARERLDAAAQNRFFLSQSFCFSLPGPAPLSLAPLSLSLSLCLSLSLFPLSSLSLLHASASANYVPLSTPPAAPTA